MPTKPTYPIEFRKKFVQQWPDYDGPLTEYCARFGVSRETAYDWLARAESFGLEGLQPRSTAPRSCPHATELGVEALLVAARKLHPSWGPRKLIPWLEERYPATMLPAPSTAGGILHRYGLVVPRRRRRRAAPRTRPFVACQAPNDVWSADFKGQFRLGDGSLCYPLTLTDNFSRYLLRCDGYTAPTTEVVRRSFEAAFRAFGLPRAIRTDNGTPFASIAPAGLSQLSIWLVRLGIAPERIKPGKPAQNGRHERMHRTLKAEVTRPPRRTLRGQQRAFDDFLDEYNNDRPHAALGQTPPARLYAPSPRPMPRKLPELVYSDQHQLRKVAPSGHIKWHGRQTFISEALRGEVVGILALSDEVSEVYFGPLLLGTVAATQPHAGLIRPAR
jgi:transposase InsO family protein